MARKLVVLFDGTGNEIGVNLSNVFKFYRMLEKDEDQLVYYDPGVGTIGKPGWWSQLRIRFQGILGLALGYGLDDNILDAYSWLCRHYRDGDLIFLHGFSRGAYTARVLAGFIHMCGLLRPEQVNLAGYALVAYKRSADDGDLEIGFNFRRLTSARRPPIRFVGVWDTVSSVITPRPDRFYLPSLQTLPFTRTNPSVETFRHAISIDERRAMFRLNHWFDPKGSVPDRATGRVRTRQVWFAGVHSDVGGGYPEKDSALSKYPLLWMIAQVRELPQEDRLRFDQRLVDWLGKGILPPDGDPRYAYVPPSPTGELHRSLTGPWWLLEIYPKAKKLKEWPARRVFLGRYIPWAEPRPIPNRPWKEEPPEPFAVHSSALQRIARCADYRPVNLPAQYAVDTTEGPPDPVLPELPPYRPESAWARLKRLFSTWPAAAQWRNFSKEAGWLAIFLAVVGGTGGFVTLDPDLGPALPAAAALALVAALVEEGVFRGLFLKPPSNGASGLGPAALSAALFTLWHPLQVLLCQWTLVGRCPLPWSWLGFNPWFLAACFALGFACARLVLASRSIWPAVALHWLVAVTWVALFGGPG